MKNNFLSKKCYINDSLMENTIYNLNRFFNNIYETREKYFWAPKDIGDGYYKRMLLGKSIEISTEKIKYNEDTKMSGKSFGDAYSLYFSLNKDMNWREEYSKRDFSINEKLGAFMKINEIFESCILEKEKKYNCLSISISKERLKEYFNIEEILKYNSLKENKFFAETFEVNESIRKAILDIENCPYKSDIKYMYIESKALEIFTTVISQINNKDFNYSRCKLSKTDISSIMLIKKYVDKEFTRKITIKDLALLGKINECKLKQGFKGIFGQSVYSYIIDKRLKLSINLLDEGYLINEIAYMVGYNDPSSFSRAFKKRHGYSPVNIRSR